MKLGELERLTLENIQLKLRMIELESRNLEKEIVKLREAHNGIVSGFYEANNIDPTKINMNLETGEVILQGGENAEK